MNKKKNFLVVFSFLVVLVGAVVFSGCETSRVAPEAPRPNPPAPEPLPIVLSGSVLDAATGVGIANATVSLTKVDGTAISTAVTNASGVYSFNLTALNVADATLHVKTNVTGYGYGFRIATYDKALNSAGVPAITLTKIANATTTTIGTTGGSATTPPTTDSKATTPVTVTVPPNAVPANTQVTLAAVPVVSTPPPSVPLTQNVVSSNTLSAPGVTTFGAPVTMTFNLPFQLPVGTTIPLLLLNPTTNVWENTGLNATVAAGGLTATVQVTRPGSYALLGNVSVAQTAGGKVLADNEGIEITKLEKVIGTKLYKITLTPTNRTVQVPTGATSAPVVTVVSGTPATTPANSFIFGLIQQRFGVTINASGDPGGSQTFTYNLPLTLGGFPTVVNGVMVAPPGRPTGESGDWVYVIEVNERLINSAYQAQQDGVFRMLVSRGHYSNLITAAWFWQPHNQGGTQVGPY